MGDQPIRNYGITHSGKRPARGTSMQPPDFLMIFSKEDRFVRLRL